LMFLLVILFACLHATPVFLTYNYAGVKISGGIVTSCKGNGYWVGAPAGICNPGQGWDPVNLQVVEYLDPTVGSLYISCNVVAQTCTTSAWNTTNNCDFTQSDLTNSTVQLNLCKNFTNVPYVIQNNTIMNVSRENIYSPGGPPSGQVSANINFAYFPGDTACTTAPQFNITPKLQSLDCYSIPGFGSVLFRSCADPVDLAGGVPICTKSNLLPGQTQCEAAIQYCPNSQSCQGTTGCVALNSDFVKGSCYNNNGNGFVLGCGNASGSFLVPSLTLIIGFLALFFKGF